MSSLTVIITILFFAALAIKQILNLCTVIFKGKKYIIPFRFRKCSVIYFGELGIYRRNNTGEWVEENNFTLAEFAGAEKFDKNYIFRFLFKFYLKISPPSIIMSLICIYFISLYLVVIVSPGLLESSLLIVLFFWLSIGLIIIFREIIIRQRNLILS